MSNLKVQEVKVLKTNEERIESISIGDKTFRMHDEFDYADGGIIIGLYDNEMIRKEYEELGFEDKLDESFYSMESDEPVPFDEVVCKIDLRDSQGGYVYHFDCFGNELYEE